MRNPVDTSKVQVDAHALVERAKAGDQVAFGELVKIHQHEVFTLAFRLVGDRELAADVAQDAFIRAWRALPDFRGDAKFGTWLHRITVNAAWTAQRRWLRNRTQPLDARVAEPVATDVDPEQAGVDAVDGLRLTAALTRLSASLRSVVVLKDVYDWSHAEIAEHLGISVTAAKVRLHRGRRTLRDILDAEGQLR
jgi:RNA polymerase sigma-70 factor (ECF subfamily)